MSYEIRDYKLRQIAAHESSILLIKEFIEQYEKHVHIDRTREGCILIQTAVNGRLDDKMYSNTVGMDYPVQESQGYLYVNPISYEGESVSEKIRDYILHEIPRIYQQTFRENALSSLLGDDCGNCVKDS